MEKMLELMKTLHDLAKNPGFEATNLVSTCYSLWKGKPIEKEFLELKTNAEKCKFYYDLMKNNDLLPSIDEAERKSESKSLEARKRGNTYFIAKDYMTALEVYNEALCYAPIGSESMGCVYANRSAIYLDTGFYGFCLENIELALANNYPQHLKAKLLQRKKTCETQMKQNKDSFVLYGKPEKIELSYPANPKWPFAADVMKCVKNERFGRYMVTTRDLKPGDIILLEKPFALAPIEKYLSTVCYHCMGNNFYNLKPCPKSTQVMFCSEKCADEAWERYYKYEFKIVADVYNWMPDPFAVRATLKAFTMQKNLDELKELVESIEIECETVYDIDFRQAGEREQFRAFYALSTNEQRREDVSFCAYVTSAVLLYYFLKETNAEMRQLLSVPAYENLFLELALRFGMIGETNGFGIADTYRSTKDLASLVWHGQGVFLTHSLFSHSCAPNLENFPADSEGTFGLVTLRPLKAGDQLLISYGPDFTYEPREERQKKLMIKYGFECDCMACRKDLTMQLKHKNIMAPAQYNDLVALNPNHCQYDRKIYKIAKEVKGTAANLLAHYDQHYPCKELFQLMTSLVSSIQIVAFKKPLDAVLTPKKQ